MRPSPQQDLCTVFGKWKAGSSSKPALEIQWNLGFDVSKYILRLIPSKSKSPIPCVSDPWLSTGDSFSLLYNSAPPIFKSDWHQINNKAIVGTKYSAKSIMFRRWMSVKTEPWRPSGFHRVSQIDMLLSQLCHFLCLRLLWLFITTNHLHML